MKYSGKSMSLTSRGLDLNACLFSSLTKLTSPIIWFPTKDQRQNHSEHFLEIPMLVPSLLPLVFFKRRALLYCPSSLPPLSSSPRVKCHQFSVPGVVIRETWKISNLKGCLEYWRLKIIRVKHTVHCLPHHYMLKMPHLLFLLQWTVVFANQKWERENLKRDRKEERSV